MSQKRVQCLSYPASRIILLFIGFLKIRGSLSLNYVVSGSLREEYEAVVQVPCYLSCRIPRARGSSWWSFVGIRSFVSNLRSPVSFHENRNFSRRESYELRNLLALYSPAFPSRVSHALWTQFFQFERSPLSLDFPLPRGLRSVSIRFLPRTRDASSFVSLLSTIIRYKMNGKKGFVTSRVDSNRRNMKKKF